MHYYTCWLWVERTPLSAKWIPFAEPAPLKRQLRGIFAKCFFSFKFHLWLSSWHPQFKWKQFVIACQSPPAVRRSSFLCTGNISKISLICYNDFTAKTFLNASQLLVLIWMWIVIISRFFLMLNNSGYFAYFLSTCSLNLRSLIQLSSHPISHLISDFLLS